MTTAATATNPNAMSRKRDTKKRRIMLRSSLESLFSHPVQAEEETKEKEEDDKTNHHGDVDSNSTKQAAPATPLSCNGSSPTATASQTAAPAPTSSTASSTPAKTRRRTPGTPSSLISNWNSDLKFKYSTATATVTVTATANATRNNDDFEKNNKNVDGRIGVGDRTSGRGGKPRREGETPESAGRGTRRKKRSLSSLPFRATATTATDTDESAAKTIAATTPPAEAATAAKPATSAAETATATAATATANKIWNQFGDLLTNSTPSPSTWNENQNDDVKRSAPPGSDSQIVASRAERQRGRRGEEPEYRGQRNVSTVYKTRSKATDVGANEHPLGDKNTNVASIPPHGHGDDPSSSVVSDSCSSDLDGHHDNYSGRNPGHGRRNKLSVPLDEPQSQRELQEHRHHQKQTLQQLQQQQLQLEYGKLAFLKEQIEHRMQQQKRHADEWNRTRAQRQHYHFPFSHSMGIALRGTEMDAVACTMTDRDSAISAAPNLVDPDSTFGFDANASVVSASANGTDVMAITTSTVTPGGKTAAVTPVPTTHSRTSDRDFASVTPIPGMTSVGNPPGTMTSALTATVGAANPMTIFNTTPAATAAAGTATPMEADIAPNTLATTFTTTVTHAMTPNSPSAPAHHHHAVESNSTTANDMISTNTNSTNSMSNHNQKTQKQLPQLLSNNAADAIIHTSDASELDIKFGELAYLNRMLQLRLAKRNEIGNDEIYVNNGNEKREHENGKQSGSHGEVLKISNHRRKLEQAFRMTNDNRYGDRKEEDCVNRREDGMGREKAMQRGHYGDDDDECDYYERDDDYDDHVDSRKRYKTLSRRDRRRSRYYLDEEEDDDGNDEDDDISFEHHPVQRPRSRRRHDDTQSRSKILSHYSNQHRSTSKKKKKRKRRRVETITRVIHEESSEEEGNSCNSPDKKTRRSYDYSVVPQRKPIYKSEGKRPSHFRRDEFSYTDEDCDWKRRSRSLNSRSGVVSSGRRAWDGRLKGDIYYDDEDEEESYLNDVPRKTSKSERQLSHRKDLDVLQNSNDVGPRSKHERNSRISSSKSHSSRNYHHSNDQSNNYQREKKHTDDKNLQRKGDGKISNIGFDRVNKHKQRVSASLRNDKLELDTKLLRGKGRSNISHLSILASLG